jgi:hypothetical protein
LRPGPAIRRGDARLNGWSESTGTAWANQHPITRLWLDKFTSLARMDQGLECRSYEQVTKPASGETIEFEVISFHA